jgi:hypothetical protein
MKKCLIALGAVATALLMISTATAVPQVHSTPAMNVLNHVEQKKILLEEKIETLKDKLTDSLESAKEFSDDLVDALPLGPILDLIKKIILLIIAIINYLIHLILELFHIVELIVYLIERIIILIALIVAFIQWIIDIFTPDVVASG